ncbi:MAG TPA: hypothetical protein VGI19_02715 [Candidatus Cybelea sp.]|jgi:hypothetical protein
MHPDVEPFAKAYADLQAKFFEINRKLDESSQRFLNANPNSPTYYQTSTDHGRLFDEWVDAYHALEDAAVRLQEEALKAAQWPDSHPLVQHYKRRREEIDRQK